MDFVYFCGIGLAVFLPVYICAVAAVCYAGFRLAILKTFSTLSSTEKPKQTPSYKRFVFGILTFLFAFASAGISYVYSVKEQQYLFTLGQVLIFFLLAPISQIAIALIFSLRKDQMG